MSNVTIEFSENAQWREIGKSLTKLVKAQTNWQKLDQTGKSWTPDWQKLDQIGKNSTILAQWREIGKSQPN